MSQFDQVMAKLDQLDAKITLLIQAIQILTQEQEEDLFGEDSFDERDYPDIEPAEEVIKPQMPGVTRRRVQVRGPDGFEEVDVSVVDPYLMQIVEASIAAGTFWMLYRDPSGAIRITAEDQIINTIQRKQPHDDSPDRDTGR